MQAVLRSNLHKTGALGRERIGEERMQQRDLARQQQLAHLLEAILVKGSICKELFFTQ